VEDQYRNWLNRYRRLEAKKSGMTPPSEQGVGFGEGKELREAFSRRELLRLAEGHDKIEKKATERAGRR